MTVFLAITAMGGYDFAAIGHDDASARAALMEALREHHLMSSPSVDPRHMSADQWDEWAGITVFELAMGVGSILA